MDTYEQCPVIITCRSAVYHNEFVNYVNQTLEIVEFSDRQIRNFLKAWEKELPPEKSIDQLINFHITRSLYRINDASIRETKINYYYLKNKI